MEGQLNYLGAAIFWLYIVAALVFTVVVIYTIVYLPGTSSRPQHSRDVKIFSALACTSFVTLSYNMLNVLIESFYAWHHQQTMAGRPGLRDICRWSIESTLFQDFAKAIFASTARQLWTRTALLATMSVCLFMGVEGRRRHVPRLWAFFCLGQILPISFVQNLFFLALLRVPQTNVRVAASWLPLFVAIMSWITSLIAAETQGDRWLIPAILMARASLFSPLFVLRLQSGGMEIPTATMLWFNYLHIVAWGMNAFRQDDFTLQAAFRALFEHPAVSSLGCDLIICVLSFEVWSWTSRGRDPPSTTGNDDVKHSG